MNGWLKNTPSLNFVVLSKYLDQLLTNWFVITSYSIHYTKLYENKIDRHIKYIEEKLDEYTALLAEADGDAKQKIEHKIKEQEQRKDGYKQIEKQLHDSDQKSYNFV